jgi:hypothetical protein
MRAIIVGLASVCLLTSFWACSRAQEPPQTVPADHWVDWSTRDPVAGTTTHMAAVRVSVGFVVAIGCQDPPVRVQSSDVPIQLIVPIDPFFRAALGFNLGHPAYTAMVTYHVDQAPQPSGATRKEIWFVSDGRLVGTGRASLVKVILQARRRVLIWIDLIGPPDRDLGGPYVIPVTGARKAIEEAFSSCRWR